MARQGELLMGKQGHHIRPWGYQLVKRHGVQGLAEGKPPMQTSLGVVTRFLPHSQGGFVGSFDTP